MSCSQLGLWRAVYDKEKETFRAVGLNWFYVWMLERKASTDAWHQGIGRHSEEEVAQITETDLEALSNVLGQHQLFPCLLLSFFLSFFVSFFLS